MSELRYEKFFTTLSNAVRLDIIFALRKKPLNVSELTDKLPYSQSTISHALTRLTLCEFVHLQKNGKYHYYALNKETIVPLLQIIDIHVKKFCTKKCSKCD